MDFRDLMRTYIETETEIIRNLNLDEINEAINAIVDCRNRGGICYTMGNGGSAATASHFVCDFSKGLSEEAGGKKFCFHCLNDNTPIMMAVANDFSYEEIFVYQLKGLLKQDDLVIAISGSGNSRNIIKAVTYAKEIGTPVIGISGYRGGKLKELSDYHMHVPIEDMQIVEDIHMMLDHMILRVVSQKLKQSQN